MITMPIPGTCSSIFGRFFDGAHLLAHDRDEDLALRVERPDIGTGIIFLLGQTPIARRGGRRVAALTWRLEIGGRRRSRVAACGDRIARFVDGADMRPDDAVNALIEHLLGHPLAGLAAIGRNAHEGCYCRRQGAGAQYLPPIQHVLQAIPQRAYVVGPVLHFKHDAIIGCGIDRLSRTSLRRQKGCESRLALLQSPDNAVQSGNIGHFRLLPAKAPSYGLARQAVNRAVAQDPLGGCGPAYGEACVR
jgi:hypothetical protein